MTPEHHAEAILRAAEPAAWLYRNSEGHACVQFVQGLMGDGWTEEPLYTAEAILAAVREAMEAERRAVGDFTALRDLIAEVAADLSGENPFWTAGCLADALIKKGVTSLPTPPRGE